MAIIQTSTLTCPACGFVESQDMPTDACLFFYICRNCQTILKPKPGDCCVFCSYGDVPCPPIQVEANETCGCNTAQAGGDD